MIVTTICFVLSVQEFSFVGSHFIQHRTILLVRVQNTFSFLTYVSGLLVAEMLHDDTALRFSPRITGSMNVISPFFRSSTEGTNFKDFTLPHSPTKPIVQHPLLYPALRDSFGPFGPMGCRTPRSLKQPPLKSPTIAE